MKTGFSFQLALRFLGFGAGKSRSNARRSLYGAIAGIGISLVPLVVVLVVADGMIDGISERIIALSSSHIRLADYSGTSGLTGDADAMLALAAAVPTYAPPGSVTYAGAERQGIGIVIGKKGRSGGTIRAVDPDYFSDNADVRRLLTVHAGVLGLSGPNVACIGKKLAADIGVSVGDTFRVVTMRNVNGLSVPKFTAFTVGAIISSGYQELDALWVFIPFRTGCAILDRSSSFSFVNVYTRSAFDGLEAIRHAILTQAPDGMGVYTWKELNRSQFQSFNTLRQLLVFIMLLIVFIASVNVSSALVMLVMERRKEIAILKSVGADGETITAAFVLAGFFTSLGGVLLGLPLGTLLSLHINELFSLIERFLNQCARVAARFAAAGEPDAIHLLDPAFYLERIPVTLNFAELFAIAAGTLVLGVLVSILPAYNAGRERPIETLRKF